MYEVANPYWALNFNGNLAKVKTGEIQPHGGQFGVLTQGLYADSVFPLG